MKRVLTLALAATLMVPTTFAASLPLNPPATEKPTKEQVAAAVAEYKSLSNREKRSRIKQAKHAIKAHKAAKKAGKEPSTNTLLLVVLALFIPPLAVYLHQGEINNKFWISLILTLLFFLPGLIYALVTILGNDKD